MGLLRNVTGLVSLTQWRRRPSRDKGDVQLTTSAGPHPAGQSGGAAPIMAAPGSTNPQLQEWEALAAQGKAQRMEQEAATTIQAVARGWATRERLNANQLAMEAEAIFMSVIQARNAKGKQAPEAVEGNLVQTAVESAAELFTQLSYRLNSAFSQRTLTSSTEQPSGSPVPFSGMGSIVEEEGALAPAPAPVHRAPLRMQEWSSTAAASAAPAASEAGSLARHGSHPSSRVGTRGGATQGDGEEPTCRRLGLSADYR